MANRKPQKNDKGGKRRRNDGSFVQASVKDIYNDWKKHYESFTIEVVQEANKMKHMILNLQWLDKLVKFRREGIDNYDETNIDFIEKIDGRPKSKDLLEAELDLNIFSYNSQLTEYTRLREKFIKEHKFTEEQVKEILEDKFDLIAWQDNYVKSKLSEINPTTEEDKDDSKPE